MVCQLLDFISEKNTLVLAVSQLSAFLVEVRVLQNSDHYIFFASYKL